MRITKLRKITLTDFPGRIACKVYLASVDETEDYLALKNKDFFNFLKEKRNFLDGVVITEKEVSLNESSLKFLAKIKNLNYKIKLETEGVNPQLLETLISQGLVDYVSLNIKAPKEKYPETLGLEDCSLNYLLSKIERSINVLKESEVEHEFSTILAPGFLGKKDIVKIARWLRPAKKYVLKNAGSEMPEDFFTKLRETISPFFDVVEIKKI